MVGNAAIASPPESSQSSSILTVCRSAERLKVSVRTLTAQRFINAGSGCFQAALNTRKQALNVTVVRANGEVSVPMTRCLVSVL